MDELKKKETSEAASKTALDSNKDNKGPVVVVYNDPSKRKKLRDLKKQEVELRKPIPKKSNKGPEEERPEFNIIKAKHEVKRLTIKALKKTSKEEAQAELAISLGAIPPKRKGVNYKVLKETKKKEQEEIKKLKEAEHVFASRVKTMTKKKQRKKNKNKVTNFDAGFGKVSGGLRKQWAGGPK